MLSTTVTPLQKGVLVFSNTGDAEDEGFFFGGDDGNPPFGGGGDGFGSWNFNQFGEGHNWDDSSSSYSDPAFDFIYQLLINEKLKSFEKFPGTLRDGGHAFASENQSASNDLPVDGAEWVDLFVREMMSAIGVDDARIRASRILEFLERSIRASEINVNCLC
ncbi:hypothetical protein K1719_003426 [Acacia pycnantha]|nr:hypothetical protein K1719_003426 [Acacia pycnantha]